MQKERLKQRKQNYRSHIILQKGITLIALIITIIVMLILVGVTVNVVLNGGLLDTTKEAAFKIEISQIQEALQVKKAVIVSENNGKLVDLIATNTFELIANTAINLDIANNLKEKYGSQIGIGKKGSEEVNLFYDNNSDLSESEKGWLQEIGVEPWETKDELVVSYITVDNKIGLLVDSGIDKEEKAKSFIGSMMNTTFNSSDEALIALASYYSTQAGGTAITDKDTAISLINTNILGAGNAFTEDQTLSALMIYAADTLTVNDTAYDAMTSGYLIDVETNKENTVKITIDAKEATVTIPIINRVGLYVKYDDGCDSDSDGQTDDELYMILYDDETNGLQIISLDLLHEVTLGDASDVEKTIDDYNNSVSILNSECEIYINNNSYAKSTRCVGSNPIEPNSLDKVNLDFLEEYDAKYGTAYNGQLNSSLVNDYEWQCMIELGILYTGSTYWLAGSYVDANDEGGIGLGLSYAGLTENGYIEKPFVSFRLNSGAFVTEAVPFTHKIRPVISLESNVKFSGSGSEGDPYTVSNYSS